MQLRLRVAKFFVRSPLIFKLGETVRIRAEAGIVKDLKSRLSENGGNREATSCSQGL